MGFQPERGRLDFSLPPWRLVRQRFEDVREPSVQAGVSREMAKLRPAVRPGMTVAVGVGSRGIRHLDEIVKAVVREFRAMGAEPFIVPAMGSHGGATAEGQAEVLAGYGVTEGSVGVRIAPGMDTVLLGRASVPETRGGGAAVHFSREALAADAVFVVNRVKVHTSFHGTIESGLGKMLCVGFGKHTGAAGLHRLGAPTFEHLIPAATRLVLDHVNVLGGLAVVENAYEEVAHLEVVPGPQIPEREPALLDLSRRLMPEIPFKHLDVLVVDYLGKDISGDGMDPNITGRHGTWPLTDPERDPEKIVVLRLTEASHGNACGLGLADVTTRAVVDAIDRQATWTNVVTSMELTFGRIPLWVDDDRTAIALALSTCGGVEPAEARLVRVRSTLHLEDIWVSEALWQSEGAPRADLEARSEPVQPAFDTYGMLPDLPALERA